MGDLHRSNIDAEYLRGAIVPTKAISVISFSPDEMAAMGFAQNIPEPVVVMTLDGYIAGLQWSIPIQIKVVLVPYNAALITAILNEHTPILIGETAWLAKLDQTHADVRATFAGHVTDHTGNDHSGCLLDSVCRGGLRPCPLDEEGAGGG